MKSTRGAGFPAALCLVTCVLTACGGAHTRFLSHLHRGQEYFAAGNLDKASVELRNAAQIEPKNGEALYYLGRVAERRGNIREAIGLYVGATDAAPGLTAAHASLGKLLVFAGAAKRALETIGPSLQQHPEDPDLLAVRAAAHQQLKDEANALEDAERAHALAPANENAVAILAAIYSQRGEKEHAITVVSEAVRLVPTSIDLRAVLTNLYLQNNQPEQAEEQMHRVIELEPNDMTPRNQLAVHLLRVHKVDEAQSVLEQAVRDFARGKDVAKTDQARLALVELISAQRSREQGEKTLRTFIAQDPDDLDLRLGLGALLLRTGASKDAVSVYEDVIMRDGANARGLIARDRIAAIRIAEGQTEPARKLAAEVLAKNPRDDDALIIRADIELRSNDPSSAIADLRAVLRDQPKSAVLLRTLAKAYSQKGEPALAEEALRTAMDAAPDDPSVRVELAEHLAATSRGDEAVSLLEEGTRRTPQAQPLRIALVSAYLSKRDLPAARKAAEDLRTAQPESWTGFYLSGLVALQQRRYEESATDLERALTLKPDAIEALRALVQVETACGKPAAALARVQTAIDRGQPNAQFVNLLGELLLGSKDYPRALETFGRASSLEQSWWLPYRNRALAHQGLSNPAEAIKDYQAALKSAPLEPALVVEAALYLEKQGRVDEAIAAYKALYAGNLAAQQVAANNLAMLLATYKTDQSSLDQARDLTTRFATSDNGALLDTNGWVRFKRGEYREALPVLQRASEHSPDSKVISFHLAMTELRLGMTERARSHLEAALAGSADFVGSAEARSALARLQPAKSG